MKKSIGNILFFTLSGLLLIIPGAMATLNPDYFAGRNGIEILGNVSLLNDYRGLGGMLMISGLLSLFSVFHKELRKGVLAILSVNYLALAVGRIFSIVVDGWPSETLVKATVVELIFGVLSVVLLAKASGKFRP